MITLMRTAFWPSFLLQTWSSLSWHLQPQNHGGMAQSDPFISDKVMFVFQCTHLRMIAWFISISAVMITLMRTAFWPSFQLQTWSSLSWHLQPQNHGGMAQSDPLIPDEFMSVFQYTYWKMIAWLISIPATKVVLPVVQCDLAATLLHKV